MALLSGKVAVITGASSGIGYATARLFIEEGASVVVAARRQEALDKLVSEARPLKGRAIALAGDVQSEVFARKLVEQAISSFGGLDIAFNNAGTLGAIGPTAEVDVSAWQETVQTNLTSAFMGAKYQIPALMARGGGSIIFTSSFVGYTVGFPGMAAYAASKAGLIGLTQALAVELGEHGIRVNALLPGGTDTPMGRQVADTPETRAHVAGLHALKRLATPEEIAHSALYLASDASSFTTGTALCVDGGVSVCRS